MNFYEIVNLYCIIQFIDADVDPAMQHLHSYPPGNFLGENQEFFYKPIHIPKWISMKLWIYIV